MSCSLVIQSLLRSIPGAGDINHAISELLALYRSLDRSNVVFFRGVFSAALHLVAHDIRTRVKGTGLIKAFLLGRVLIHSFLH